MARVTGPLFSVEASGSYGGVVTFAKWKGRQYVRQLVIPANPHSAGQETARNAVRVAGAVQRQINLSTRVHAENTLRDKLEITAITPGGYAWNGFLVDNLSGTAHVNIIAADAIWAALAPAEKTAWDNAAAALVPPYLAVAQTVAGGAPGTAKTAGNVFLNHEYALFAMGLVNIPTAVPPVYA